MNNGRMNNDASSDEESCAMGGNARHRANKENRDRERRIHVSSMEGCGPNPEWVSKRAHTLIHQIRSAATGRRLVLVNNPNQVNSDQMNCFSHSLAN